MDIYAVLIPYVKTEKGESLLLEVRSQKVKQPGEICFPGGKVEEGETVREAAIREACEELGLDFDDIEVISEHEPLMMGDGRKVYPVSARLQAMDKDKLELSEDEVAEVFLLPVSWLREHLPVHINLATTPAHDIPDKLLAYLSNYGDYRDEGETDYLEFEGYVIWGLTARIIKRIADQM